MIYACLILIRKWTDLIRIAMVAINIRVAAGTCQVITASSFAAIMVASSWAVVAFGRAYPSIVKDSLATTSSSIEEVTVASSVVSPSSLDLVAASWVEHIMVVVGPYRAFAPTCFMLVTSEAAWVVIAS